MSAADHNPAWTVADLTAAEPCANWCLRPSAQQQAQLAQVLESSGGTPHAELGPDALPADCEPLWQAARDNLATRYGFCLLQGLPLGPDTDSARRMCFLAGLALGTPVFQDDRGARLADIRGTGHQRDDAARYTSDEDGARFRSDETGEEFPPHSDPADVAGLFCIRAAAEGGVSTVASAMALHDYLREAEPDIHETLCAAYPYYKPKRRDEPVSWFDVPVFSWHQGYFKSHVVPHLIATGQQVPGMPQLSQAQQRALSTLYDLTRSPRFGLRHRLAPGELLLVNNHLVFHGRDAYRDEGEDQRHLLRLWLSVPFSRPLHRSHAWLGDCAAGSLRGGILPERLGTL